MMTDLDKRITNLHEYLIDNPKDSLALLEMRMCVHERDRLEMVKRLVG